MKNKICALYLAFCVLLSCVLILPAKADNLSGFPDIQDARTANAAEVLRLMGVLDGYEDGLFHPDYTLTRAQFCKIVVNFIGADDELDRYSAFTIFPDVKPSYWAAGYINLAARGRKIILGYADGYFHPDNAVTLGQAVTILLRLSGYKDEEIGGAWPDSFIGQARAVKMLENISGGGYDNLTRAQAAVLFRNMLEVNNAAGTAAFTFSDETTLTSLDGGAGKLVTSDQTYDMDKPRDSTFFINSRGRVVLRGDKALTFLPLENHNNFSAPSAGAVIIGANGSASALSALTGNRINYNIYKNGLPATASDLRAGDVATYSAVSNSVLICDTRLTAYYENCYPSPSAPTTIELLNGTVFNVLPTAVDSVAQFRPGKLVTFLLSADGQIAGAVSENGTGNAIALLDSSGAARLLCGATEIPLKASAAGTVGQPVNVMSDEKNNIYFTALRNNLSGDLDLQSRTLGNRKLAANVRFFDSDGPLSLDQIEKNITPSGEISGIHTNWAGDIDIIIFGASVSATWYGRASVSSNNDSDAYTRTLTIIYGDGKSVGPAVNPIRDVKNGEYLAVQLNRAGNQYTSIRTMQKLENISFNSWIGKTAVTYGGRTYTVSESVPCYNKDTGRWVNLDTARAYAGHADLYIADGAVRIVEIGE